MADRDGDHVYSSHKSIFFASEDLIIYVDLIIK